MHIMVFHTTATGRVQTVAVRATTFCPMKALASFTVRPRLPEALAPLHGLALNLRWSWHQPTQELFRRIDPEAWASSGRDPIRLLSTVGRDRLEALAHDTAFLALLHAEEADRRAHMEDDKWFQDRPGEGLRRVAYFSPEFGIAAALPQYSGGLGVLAGDHLKAASGLGVPIVGVGLLYDYGYFRQELDADGWQRETYVSVDPHAMALSPVDCPLVEVDLAGTPLLARVWKAQVGRIPLYLLDSDVPENAQEERRVTDRLYGGDSEHRLRQEILLGVGGIRALEATGTDVQVFHSNEGHAGFLGLERIRRLVTDEGLGFSEALEAVRAGTVFTTHTPVPAGIDRFPRPLMERYFKSWAGEFGIDFDTLMALGHEPADAADAPFNMAVMGLRLAGASNGVSKLHGDVSRHVFEALWPTVPAEERPIGAITNGVHAPTWVAPEIAELLSRHLPEWPDVGPHSWANIDDIADAELWAVRQEARARLVAFVRRHLRQPIRAQRPPFGGGGSADVLDPEVLTIGFARRFASYKRANLMLSQPDRLTALLLDPDRPIQLVFAGKAHPADDAGKEMIRQVVDFARRPDVRHRVAFLEDYDIEVARMLYQGCDVWLNTPRRPLEACGTSGEKAALNGVLNCSILDGWWDELYDGHNGWAIASSEWCDDLARRDHLEAASLFELLETEIVPLFYDRPEGAEPSGWVRRVKASLQSLGPVVTARRMVCDYVEEMYEPAALRDSRMRSGDRQPARELAAWKQRVTAAWSGVRVISVDGEASVTELDESRPVSAQIELGGLAPADVEVQLLHGVVGPGDELVDPEVAVMHPAAGSGNGVTRYEGSFTCHRAGHYGFTARVVPSHTDLTTFAELGCITWA